ncbi:sulfotransferase family protein [Planktothrix paucivesiculata]|uniref:Sulfotransferase n=1 Tax=Planktothrix paucivesiculata PCC 9631 TaxID=671071 RepID=A0A7Z9BEU3_9CYAN|nr:sulfotransferase domain-containing protein [Planktothrix paucivesiculata]VXD11002.1 Sulfotransferase [Planktothrix paucivesiculata PCC 9631]
MIKPQFIIIGAAKSGTTTLYQYLCRHPQVFMSTPKEPDFFSVDAHYAQGMDWYESLFHQAKPDQICGEASTTYSRLQQYPHTVERLVKALPEVKLIYIMRHPVDRAYSFYVHRFKGSRHKPELAVEKTFEETIAKQSEFIDSSFYFYQIEQYLKFYPRESFLFLPMEDLIQHPLQMISQILTFLGADPTINLMEESTLVANKAEDDPEWFVRKQITSSFKQIPGIEQLKSLLPQPLKDQAYQWVRHFKYKQWKSQQYMPPPMRSETRQMLLEKFREPNQQLAEFLNWDLSHWNR